MVRRWTALGVADVLIGLVMIFVALWLHLVIPGLPFALMVLGGILLAVTGFIYR